MYAVVRRYRFDPNNSEEINRRVRDAFVHLLRKTPGFEAYYWLDTGEGEGASLRVFRDKAGVEESHRRKLRRAASGIAPGRAGDHTGRSSCTRGSQLVTFNCFLSEENPSLSRN